MATRWMRNCAVGASALLLAGLATTAIGAAAGATPKNSPIVIGYITSITGNASSTFADGPGGAQARVDLQNAHGGVNGHPLKLVVEDDQSSVSTDLTAAQDLVANKHA
ncbi:MAG TPA: ABC transporter substrate-binding protein, partial [Acidimicrobiales bacterium]|nr:ABC transporter substrate-binding protein [Acidimicrobiales bacterium]